MWSYCHLCEEPAPSYVVLALEVEVKVPRKKWWLSKVVVALSPPMRGGRMRSSSSGLGSKIVIVWYYERTVTVESKLLLYWLLQ
jgi:hypothetical protein